jgi:hypothetical protein
MHNLGLGRREANTTQYFEQNTRLEKLVARMSMGNLFNTLGNKNRYFA